MTRQIPKTYQPNGKRECERRVRQAAKIAAKRPFFECPDCGKDIADTTTQHGPGCG